MTARFRRVAIVQSSYIPWRGAFALIDRCDCLVFLDSVQFTRRDWRNRNRIKTAGGAIWLSIPVRQRGNYQASIDAIEIAEAGWAERHLRSIELAYRRAPYFAAVFPSLEAAYQEAADLSLSAVNRGVTAALCGMLGIETALLRDTEVLPPDVLARADATVRLALISAALGAETYVSGPAARRYLDTRCFHARGIRVHWIDYSGLAPYPQLWGDFDPHVSIVDALFNLGFEGARAALAGCRETAEAEAGNVV